MADPGLWNATGDPLASGRDLRLDPVVALAAAPGTARSLTVDFQHHYQQAAGPGQRAEVVASFDDGSRQVLWSADSADGARFDVSQPVHLTVTAPAGAKQVRIGWHLTATTDTGYWAVDAPKIR